jgi:hypothetical protein
MKKVIWATLLMSSFAVTSYAADGTSISGKWKVHSVIDGDESDVTCNFTQKDKDLSGSCTTDKGEKTMSGKIDGKTISFSYDSEYDGSPYTAKYSGSFDASGQKLIGAVVIDAFGVDGDFTATPDK